MPDDQPFILNLPELSDKAVVAIHHFLQDLVDRFENQYFAQMHRHDQEIRQRRLEQLAPPPRPGDDPPF